MKNHVITKHWSAGKLWLMTVAVEQAVTNHKEKNCALFSVKSRKILNLAISAAILHSFQKVH